jgi:hypothetical protein
MTNSRESAHAALKRLLVNGRLTGLPRRPADQELLIVLAAGRIDAHRSLLESEVNEQLRAWLEEVSEPFGIDHVTLRRMLVDGRMLLRTSTGSMYRVNAEKLAQVAALAGIQPAEVLAQIQDERAQRKRQHGA